MTARWRMYYNTVRPHSSLGYRPPAPDAIKPLPNCSRCNWRGGVSTDEWLAAMISFQKRHLLAHTMGVIDEEYVRKTGDAGAVVGRKIVVSEPEVRGLVDVLRKLGSFLCSEMEKK